MCVSIGVGFPVTIHAMLNDHMDRSPIQLGLNSLLHPKRFPSQEAWYRQLMVSDRLLADYFDRQRLPDGAGPDGFVRYLGCLAGLRRIKAVLNHQ